MGKKKDKKRKEEKKRAQEAAELVQEDERHLAVQARGTLRVPARMRWSCGMLEAELLKRFPAKDAESWDRTGLLAGDPDEEVRGIAVALDPTVEAVRAAQALGANVLLTHHPAFLDAPGAFGPARAGEAGPGAVVWEAVRSGVALMNFHTALDVSAPAQEMLPRMLGLRFQRVLEPLAGDAGKGYGQVCEPADEGGTTLRQLAARCVAVFGKHPRVWGDMDRRLSSVVTCTGSAGDLDEKCLAEGADCLVCGEIRYHHALAASQAGLAIIDLGHDVSELPLCGVLAQTLTDLGFPDESVAVLDQGDNWNIPEAIRK